MKLQKLIGVFALLGIMIFGLSSCNSENTSETINSTDATNQTNDYPASYKSEGLPEYPNATLVNVRMNEEDGIDGMSLKLTTEDPISDIQTFFDTQMTNLGWNAPERNLESQTTFTKTYTSGQKSFYVMATKMNDQPTSINIIIGDYEGNNQ